MMCVLGTWVCSINANAKHGTRDFAEHMFFRRVVCHNCASDVKFLRQGERAWSDPQKYR